MTDTSSRPHTFRQALDEVQRAIVTELREQLNMSRDNIRRVVRRCLGFYVDAFT